MERKDLKWLLLNDKEMIYENGFFESLKSTSLLDFRRNVNFVQDIRPSLYLEEKIRKYYEELLCQYNGNSGLFWEYEKVLDCFQKEDFAFLENYRDFNYFLDEEMLVQLEDYRHYGNKLEIAYSYLLKHTSRKISEIVVDGLFQDNIYNVWLNIREMFRYHEGLAEDQKLLSNEKSMFYREILNIDNMQNSEKMDMYHCLKDKNIALMFYEDWNLLKRDSYQKMKEHLLDLKDKEALLNQEESEKYGVPIYELTGEDFYIMISCKKGYKNFSRARRLCCSLITHYHMNVFSKKYFMYGYTGFKNEDIFHVFEKDICSRNGFDSNSFTTNYVNRIFTLEQIGHAKGHSEIQLVQKRCSFHSNSFKTISPSYLIVFDTLEDRHIQEAKRLGIPIVRIDTTKYLARRDEKTIVDFGVGKFDNIVDVYVNDSSLEKVRCMRR